MYRIFRFAILLIMSTVVLGIQNANSQKMCQHLNVERAYAEMNTFDPRSDTFDVLMYEIDAAFIDHQNAKHMDATTTITVVKKFATDQVTFDLLDLNVTEVRVEGQSRSFTSMSPLLTVDISNLSQYDTLNVAIDYNGTPQRDPQWGGFYFSDVYAFNMGVGFASDPHNFGRVWFPCFDNFTDRAEYRFNITVDTGMRAYCNGLLDTVTQQGATMSYHWVMDDPIPTYLASVAIAPYAEIEYLVDGIPVTLVALEADTANVRSSFIHLSNCIQQFVDKYGEHSFDRVGFTVVPFNAGAMEHATNIAYPRYAVKNGDLVSETLFAHELAHHWWGNTTTCSSQEDMWLNEGWASYSESLFLEGVYGKERYAEHVEENHRSVLQFAHIRDGAALPVSGIGHANTYGSHVYNKGADMVHTLRGIMGDEAFFNACRSFQSTFKFEAVSTDDMYNRFQAFTSNDLKPFFDQWVRTAGFAHFDLLGVGHNFSDNTYDLFIKQTPRFNNEVYHKLPIQVTAFSADFMRYDTTILLDQEMEHFMIRPSFEPEAIFLDFDDRLSDAVTTATDVISEVGERDYSIDGLAVVDVVDLADADSILLRIEHHWAPADATYGLMEGVVISRQRYWNVNGVWPEGVQLDMTLTYSAIQTTSSLTYGYLDDQLIRITEDSLVLLYRENGSSPWVEYDNYVRGPGSLFDKRGTMEVSSLRRGQYALGIKDADLASDVPKYESRVFEVSPNPVNEKLQVKFGQMSDSAIIEITDARGMVVKMHRVMPGESKAKINTTDLAAGTYFIGMVSKNRAYDLQRFVVSH